MSNHEPQQLPTAMSYRRCSHKDSQDSGLGLEAQTERMEAYIALLQTKISVKIGPMFSDELVSAYRRRLIFRPQGKKLNRVLKRGDHVVFARLDRAFRNMYDLVDTIRIWDERGIIVHFVEEGLDLSNPFGRAMMHIIGAIAQLHSDYTSIRNKESASKQRKVGRPTHGRPKYGFKRVGPRGRRRYVPDPEQRRVGQEVVRARRERHMTWAEISEYIEGQIAILHNRKPRRPYEKQQWSRGTVERAYRYELKLQEEERARAIQKTIANADGSAESNTTPGCDDDAPS